MEKETRNKKQETRNKKQTNSYYPFGFTLLQNNGNTSDTYKKNKYLYNGKEIQDDNLNSKFFGMLDYGARFYDPQIGRWHSVDSLAEGYDNFTPYNYVLNNPISFIDPDGMKVVDNGDRYTITEDDIYNYLGYLMTINEGSGSMKNLQESCANASGKNEGAGGAFESSIDGVDVVGKKAEHWWNEKCGMPQEDRDAVIKDNPELITGLELFPIILPGVGAGKIATETRVIDGTITSGTEMLAIGTTRMRLLNRVQNPKLKKLIEYLYREAAKFGDGSTGAMIKEELANGTITSGSGSHIQKAKDALNTIRGLLKGNSGNLSESDRKIVFEVIENLTDGTGLKW